MTVTREDMLRELELLPVWRLRAPAETLPAATLPEQVVLTQTVALAESIALKTSIVEVEQVTIAEPVATDVPGVIESPMVEARVEVVAEALVIQEPLDSATAAVSRPDISHEPLLQSSWLLYSPQSRDTASQQLLQNIVRALQVPVEEVALQQQAVSLQQVKARFGVLFGLDAANQFLGTAHHELDAVRGQLFTHGDMRYVITHGPSAMLENPQLKREVWHDLCLLLAQKDAGMA